MISVVFDANVIVSGFPASRGAPAELIERWLARPFHLSASEHILDGVERAWHSPWFRSRYPANQAEIALDLLRTRATILLPAPQVAGIAADEEDDLVLATAVAAEADYLVTGDKQFQIVKSIQGIEICSPREFLAILDRIGH